MKTVMGILCAFLSCWIFILLNTNKNLTHHNLHAERSIKELMLEKRLTEKYLFTPPDTLFRTTDTPELYLLINNDENIQTLIHYLRELFPCIPLTVFRNQKNITGYRDYYDRVLDFPEDFNIRQNIVLYSCKGHWEYVIIFETQNAWHLNMDLNILRKLDEEKI